MLCFDLCWDDGPLQTLLLKRDYERECEVFTGVFDLDLDLSLEFFLDDFEFERRFLELLLFNFLVLPFDFFECWVLSCVLLVLLLLSEVLLSKCFLYCSLYSIAYFQAWFLAIE